MNVRAETQKIGNIGTEIDEKVAVIVVVVKEAVSRPGGTFTVPLIPLRSPDPPRSARRPQSGFGNSAPRSASELLRTLKHDYGDRTVNGAFPSRVKAKFLTTRPSGRQERWF